MCRSKKWCGSKPGRRCHGVKKECLKELAVLVGRECGVSAYVYSRSDAWERAVVLGEGPFFVARVERFLASDARGHRPIPAHNKSYGGVEGANKRLLRKHAA